MGDLLVGLSTASVYPENTEAAFRYSAEIGYDGVELMIWAESISQDTEGVRELSRKYGVPVMAVHAPCLLISQRVMGSDPVMKLERSAQMAVDLGARTVVVHPPFRWQRRYAEGFLDQVADLEEKYQVQVAVENMFPLRADGFFIGRKEGPAARLLRRGGPGLAVSAFAPSYDPTKSDFAHYTLDLSHTATAGMDARALALRMGSRLCHLHLTDGTGEAHDEHLVPGEGTQPCAEVCQQLVRRGIDFQTVLEINTQSARTPEQRAAKLAKALDFARVHVNGLPSQLPEDEPEPAELPTQESRDE
jgi:sugar phosphate isomerase/epimerase